MHAGRNTGMTSKSKGMSTGHSNPRFVAKATVAVLTYLCLSQTDFAGSIACHSKLGELFASCDGSVSLFPMTQEGASSNYRLWLGEAPVRHVLVQLPA